MSNNINDHIGRATGEQGDDHPPHMVIAEQDRMIKVQHSQLTEAARQIEEEQNISVSLMNQRDSLRRELASLKAEHAKEIASILAVIQRVEDPIIERGDRTLDDWLAQIFQVLVMDRGNYATECEQLKQQIEKLTGERDAAKKLNQEWNRAMGEFAAGSEYVDDPKRTTFRIKESRRLYELLAETKRDKLKELLRKTAPHVQHSVYQNAGTIHAQIQQALAEPPAKPIAGEPGT